ncbi:hypothetical protein C8J57DRAFT_1539487 [Mycena rebaudengoi]|nr:hypothetical protein C8J57DRAFT_1539487 [Mycena rebaudengoi]
MSFPTCVPFFCPREGFALGEHDLRADTAYYVVFKGRKEYIFTHCDDATEQVIHVSNGRMKAAPTYAQALALWNAHCRAEHGEPCVFYPEQENAQGPQLWAVRGVINIFSSQADAIKTAGLLGKPATAEFLASSTNKVYLQNFARGV